MKWFGGAIFALITGLQVAASLGWFAAVDEPRHYQLAAMDALAVWLFITGNRA